MDDIIRIIKLPENLGLLKDGVSETVKYKIKKEKGEICGMTLGTLGGSMLGNVLTGKVILKAGKGVVRAGKGCNNRDQNF